jgi:AMMECR1 domain-containing protein
MPEQRWDQDAALVSVMKKAGFRGSKKEAMRMLEDGRVELTTYESSKNTLSFTEYEKSFL